MISPNTPTRSVCSAGSSGLPSAPMTNGISEMWVTPCSTTVGQNRLCDHFGISTAVAPTPSTENKRPALRVHVEERQVDQVACRRCLRSMLRGPDAAGPDRVGVGVHDRLGPAGRARGEHDPERQHRLRSRGRSSRPASREQRVEGVEAVAGSSSVGGSPLLSSVTAIHFSAGAASATSRRVLRLGDGGDARRCARRSRSISAPTDFVLVVTATAPSVAQASHASTISGQFSEWMSTLSPLAMPRAARPAARPRTSVEQLGVGPAPARRPRAAPRPAPGGRACARPSARAARGCPGRASGTARWRWSPCATSWPTQRAGSGPSHPEPLRRWRGIGARCSGRPPPTTSPRTGSPTALADRHPGADVESVEVIERHEVTNRTPGCGSSYRDPGGAPEMMFCKLPPTDDRRGTDHRHRHGPPRGPLLRRAGAVDRDARARGPRGARPTTTACSPSSSKTS